MCLESVAHATPEKKYRCIHTEFRGLELCVSTVGRMPLQMPFEALKDSDNF